MKHVFYVKSIFDSNVDHETINEILYYFQKIFQRAEHIGSKIFICGLIPRPKYPHLKNYFEKASSGIFQLSRQYKCATFIDCQSLFYDSQGRILCHYYKKDLIHLNNVGSKILALHVFNVITQK